METEEMKTLEAESAPSSTDSPEEEKTKTESSFLSEKKPLDLRLLMEICLGLAVLVLLALLIFRPKTPEEDPQDIPEPELEETLPEETEEPAVVTVRFHTPEGTEEKQFTPGETLTLEEGAAIDGYTFLRWRDAEGQNVTHRSFHIWEDADFYAVYGMALDKKEHSPYMALDENGAFRPGDGMTRRDVARILYEMLDTKLVGDGQFLDVAEDDEGYRAIATLKQLGILSGSRFHPDETITRREFFEILCGFFPDSDEKALFSDLDETDPAYPLFCVAAQHGWVENGEDIEAAPDRELKRIEFVCILNQILDRHGDSSHRQKMVGTIVDVSSKDPRFWDVAEATLVHTHKGDGAEERWITSEALPILEEGFFFLGSQLHAIGPTGDPIVNEEYKGLFFNENGVETSGLPELDELIWAVLDEQVKPEIMQPEEMLSRLFFYVSHRFGYRLGNYYPLGEPSGWEAQEALEFLQKRTGNCYSYAATFYELARAIGFDAKAYTGGILGRGHGDVLDVHGDPIELPLGRCPHGWVEIEFNGESFIFDPEMCYLHVPTDGGIGFYKLGDYNRIRYGYIKSLEEAEEQAAANVRQTGVARTEPPAETTAPTATPTPGATQSEAGSTPQKGTPS